jgi:chloride channel protein, CIC family
MSDDAESSAPPLENTGGLLMLACLSLIAGVGTGILGASFRLALTKVDHLRGTLIAWAHGERFVGFLLVAAVCGVATFIAAWLVRRLSPHASGSGMPYVEAVLDGELPPEPFHQIAVKFVGGVLAIGSGLALGREGPSVQMGASFAHIVGVVFRRNWADCRVLLAAGAGAGLATAFNAPIAGAIFVLEELVRRFEPRIAIAALAASATAISVSRVIGGDVPDFHVMSLHYASAESRPLYFALGLIAGLVAIIYNRVLLATIASAERLKWPVELRAAAIGAGIGVLAWFAPSLVGGGDPITQRTLDGGVSLALLSGVFLIRFALGSVSYAAGTPGGLFAPLLVLGAQLGLFCGTLCGSMFPGLDLQPEGFAVVGMAALFTGIVRAPLTGIVLVAEMTSSVTMLLPMLGACFVAMLVPTLLRNAPIYDSLKALAMKTNRTATTGLAADARIREAKE